MSKLSDFLEKAKIDPRRVLAASTRVEHLRPEDRSVKLARTRVRTGKASDSEKERAGQGRRSGKPVTKPTLDAALGGQAVSSKARQRIVRAVNQVLEQKKQDQVQASDLF